MLSRVPCPYCKKSAVYQDNPFRPFCSERCKRLDLGAWASEDYVIAGKSTEVDDSNLSTGMVEDSPNPKKLH